LNTAVLRDRRRKFSTAAAERRQLAQQAAQRLDQALARLEGMLERAS
jgi:hypothetical protein